MKKLFAYLFCSVSLPILLTAPALAAPSAPTNISSRPGMHFGHQHHNALTGTTSLTSENWSGYAVTGANGAFNSVSSSWTQPAVSCTPNSKNSYSAYWVGLDGFSDSTVEQIGTEADCINHTAVYSSWYEMYPSNPYEVSTHLAIHPGDHLAATVKYQPAASRFAKGSYLLLLSDSTTSGHYSTTLTTRQSYARSSAEVITEAPASSNSILPLANYGAASYTNSLVNNAPLGNSPDLQEIIMQNPAGMVSTPSNFDPTNENFSTAWSAS